MITETSPPKRDRKLSWKELAGFGIGGVANNLGTDALKQLAAPIYNIILGLNPAWIGFVLMLGRLWDAMLDPAVGARSDNLRSRWGRRKPFVIIGAVACAVTFPLIWMVPRHWGETAMFAYLIATSLLFYTAFAIFSVPYFTLGMEISPDYDERTRATATRVFFSTFAGLLITWTFRLTQLDVFTDPLSGMRWMGLGIGLLFLVTALPPGFLVRERYEKLAHNQRKVPLLQSVRMTLYNKPFLLILAISVLMILGGTLFNALGVYVITYYVCNGEIKAAATLLGLSGTIATLTAIAGVPAVAWVSERRGKVQAACLCASLGIVGSLMKWFLYTPEAPYRLLWVAAFMGPVLPGLWTIVHSMKADVCDYDEWHTGMRREGIYAALSMWVHKCAVSATFLLSGLILNLVGFDQKLGGAQTGQAITLLRALFSLAPIFFFLACIFCLVKYPLSRRRMEALRKRLEARRSSL